MTPDPARHVALPAVPHARPCRVARRRAGAGGQGGRCSASSKRRRWRTCCAAGIFDRIFEALAAENRETGTAAIDATCEGAPDCGQSAKQGIFRAVPGAPKAASTPNCARSAMAAAGRRSRC